LESWDPGISNLASEVLCTADAILTAVGDSFYAFINSYLATMLRHICTVYALINAQDANIYDVGIRKGLHFTAYVIMVIDLCAELLLLHTTELADSDSMKIDTSSSCGTQLVGDITDH